MKKILIIPLLTTLFAFGQSFVPDAPELDLKSYILIEPNTNTVIAEFNSTSEIEPASMTKIMTAYVAADQISNELIAVLCWIFITSPVFVHNIAIIISDLG